MIQTNEEKEIVMRSFLTSVGWREMYVELVKRHREKVRDQIILDQADRDPDYAKWSDERLKGYILGVGWSLIYFPELLKRIEAQNRASIPPEVPIETGHGHPYAADDAIPMP